MNYINEIKKDVISEMKDIISGQHYSDRGLCWHLYKRIDGIRHPMVHEILEECFISWPLYSGDEDYPVPHPDGIDPFDAFNDCGSECKMYTGVYGKRRLMLAQHIIDKLEKEINQ